MEGVTYAMRDSLAIIEELGVPVRQIRASGGGSQEPAVAADPGRRVRPQRSSRINAEEGPAYGVALLAAVGRGRVQEHRRSLRGDDPRGRANASRSTARQALRPGVSDLSAALSFAPGRLQADRRTLRAAW